MFKIFHGYGLVEAYHKWKKAHRVEDKTISRAIRLVIAVAVCLTIWCLPVENWIDGMTIIQKRTLAIFVFAILMWLFEAVAAWTTSVMVVVLLLFTTSNSSLVFFYNGVDAETMKMYSDLPANAKTLLTTGYVDVAPAEKPSSKLLDGYKNELKAVCDSLASETAVKDGLEETKLDLEKKIEDAQKPYDDSLAKYNEYTNHIKSKEAIAYLSTADSASVARLDSLVKVVNANAKLAKAKTIDPSNAGGYKELICDAEVDNILTPYTVELLDTKTLEALTKKDDKTKKSPIQVIPAADVCQIKALGPQTNYKSILACFADPIIMLFIGGFILAIAASKTGLDLYLARVMLKPFGKNPKYVLLGFLMVTGVFSMFLSNTATAAMMLTFLGPVLKALPADGKGKTALALAIPIAANIGGMGTPIGTPPNAIALKYMSEIGINVGFGQWMAFMIPFTLLLLFISWVMLIKLFPFKAKTIELNIEGELKKDWRSIVVYITFICTVLLWVLDKATGVNANVVAMLPVGVFAIIGVLTKRDLEEISWSVLWMVAGGFALGVALKETGLADTLIAAVPFANWPAILIVVGSGLICYLMANFISHTATANLLVPILASVGASAAVATNLAGLGGVSTLLVGVAIGSSLGMVLPISTPPNAIAASTGMIDQKDMVKTGLIMGIVGLVLGYVMLIVLGSAGFFN